jgi:acyl-CoA synthetase (AMP-forming)/AMP-acid ligase II
MTTLEFLDRGTDVYGDAVGVIAHDGTEYTYNEFGERVARAAAALSALGVEQGDRVALLSPNTHWFLETLFATNVLGAVSVPLNYRLIADDYEYILEDSGARVVVADHEYAGKIETIRDRVPPHGVRRQPGRPRRWRLARLRGPSGGGRPRRGRAPRDLRGRPRHGQLHERDDRRPEGGGPDPPH